MKPFRCIKIGMFVLSFLLMVSTSFAGGLPNVWTEIDPAVEYPGFEYNGLTPACTNAPGTTSDKFTFFAKAGKENKLVVYFQGGGACWDVMNCVYAPTCTQQQSETIDSFANTTGRGIFDTANPDNPFKDWGFVYIPYCTGDLFWGANDATYGSWTIQHRGFVNFQVVLKWLKNKVRLPRKVFVTGSSAGSYGAIMSFPYIREAYPLSMVYVLGDAGNGITGGNFTTGGITNWNIQIPAWIFPEGYTPDMTIDQVYTDIAAEYPWSKVAQYTTAYDWNQTFFYYVMLNIYNPTTWQTGWPTVWCDWHGQMLDYVYNTAAEAPNYRYYIAAGTDHTIMMSPKFYTEESAGIPYVQWVNAMVNNPFGTHSHFLEGKWKNLECEDCVVPLPCP